MPCRPVTPAMFELLEAFTAWPDAEIEDLKLAG
jgi:hypothetical protein